MQNLFTHPSASGEKKAAHGEQKRGTKPKLQTWQNSTESVYSWRAEVKKIMQPGNAKHQETDHDILSRTGLNNPEVIKLLYLYEINATGLQSE